jgi:hypothetical protein
MRRARRADGAAVRGDTRRMCAVSALLLGAGGCTVFPSEGVSSDASAPEVTVLPNHALSFDGLADFATSGTAGFPTGAAPQTLSLWVRYSQPSGTQAFLVLRRNEASGVELGIRDGALEAWTVFGGRTLVQAPALPAAGVWHHVAFVLAPSDGGLEPELFVDGNLTATGAAQPDNLTPVSCWIGTFDGLSELYAGDMDEIRIWNIERTVDQIVEEMQGNVPEVAPGLVAYFDGDEIEGDRLPDKSGNGNDATLGGGDPARMPTLVPSGLPTSVAP